MRNVDHRHFLDVQADLDRLQVPLEELKGFGGSTGKVRAAPGAALPDAEIAGMNWFVEGIQGAMPR